ncbi:MAG: hypothetical protein PVF32_07345, partial [Desulfobacterales bacterium]
LIDLPALKCFPGLRLHLHLQLFKVCAMMVRITCYLSSKFYPRFIPINGYMVSGVRCQDSTPGGLRLDSSYETLQV